MYARRSLAVTGLPTRLSSRTPLLPRNLLRRPPAPNLDNHDYRPPEAVQQEVGVTAGGGVAPVDCLEGGVLGRGCLPAGIRR